MKLKKFVKVLQDLMKERPETANLDLFCDTGEGPALAIEGKVLVGWIDEENDGEFIDEAALEQLREDGDIPEGAKADVLAIV